jgi:hypothetical protein
MATTTGKRKVFRVEGEVKLIREKKSDVFSEFGLVNSTIQNISETEPKLLVLLKRRDGE